MADVVAKKFVSFSVGIFDDALCSLNSIILNFDIYFLVIQQDFKIHVAFETYVILGNDALLKCEVPSFVSDLVDIFGWIDNGGNQFLTDFNYG